MHTPPSVARETLLREISNPKWESPKILRSCDEYHFQSNDEHLKYSSQLQLPGKDLTPDLIGFQIRSGPHTIELYWMQQETPIKQAIYDLHIYNKMTV